MSNREIVEGIIADWRRLEASARMRLADGSFPLVLPAEIDSCASRAWALERLLAVADAATTWHASHALGLEQMTVVTEELASAVRAWEEP